MTELKYQCAIYCLKNNTGNLETILPLFEEHLEHNKESSELQFLYLLILINSEVPENCRKAWIFLRELIENDQNNTQYLALASILFECYLDSP